MSEFAYKNQIMGHGEIISTFVKLMGCNKYLELGIWDGQNINEISKHCEYCVGVDINSEYIKYFNYKLKIMDTDTFFQENTDFFDIIFIDANHDFEFVQKDFDNSLKILNEFGIIFIDLLERKQLYLQCSLMNLTNF